MQQKSLSNVSETKHDQMLISGFSQKVEPIRNCSFFPVKSFAKTDSTLIIFFLKKIENKGKGLKINEEHYCRKGFKV